MRSLTVTALFVFVAFSACVSNPPKTECGDPTCPPASPTPEYFPVPPGSPFLPLPVNESLRSMRLEGCTGLSLDVQLPEEGAVDDDVPPGFEPSPSWDGTRHLYGDALHCIRAVLPGTILTDYYEFQISPKVVPDNASWATGANSFLVWDYYTSSPAATTFLNSLGYSARTATFQVAPIVSGGVNKESWTVSENDTRFEFEFLQSFPLIEPLDTTSPANGTVFLWAGANPYLKTTRSGQYTPAELGDLGVFGAEGPSHARKAMAAPVAPWSGIGYLEYDFAMVVHPEFYEANP